MHVIKEGETKSTRKRRWNKLSKVIFLSGVVSLSKKIFPCEKKNKQTDEQTKNMNTPCVKKIFLFDSRWYSVAVLVLVDDQDEDHSRHFLN